MKGSRIYLFLAVFVLPYVLVSLPHIPLWLGHTAATSVLVFVGTAAILWVGLSRHSKFIRTSGKLSEPQYADSLPKIEKGIRLMVLGMALLICFTTTFPLASDLGRLAIGNEPARITGLVAYRTVPFMGIVVMAQSIRFSRKSGSYYSLYSLKPIRVGTSYEFVVLPRSRFIVDFRKAGQ
jgi:hypothetical protein